MNDEGDERIMTTLNELRDEIHQNAIDHGWWQEERPFAEIIALIHSELSEALEEYRNGRPLVYYNCCEAEKHPCLPKDEIECVKYGQEEDCEYRGQKPEGIAVELADVVIRILDYCGAADIDIEQVVKIKHEYNKSRPYRHGGKRI